MIELWSYLDGKAFEEAVKELALYLAADEKFFQKIMNKLGNIKKSMDSMSQEEYLAKHPRITPLEYQRIKKIVNLAIKYANTTPKDKTGKGIRLLVISECYLSLRNEKAKIRYYTGFAQAKAEAAAAAAQ